MISGGHARVTRSMSENEANHAAALLPTRPRTALLRTLGLLGLAVAGHLCSASDPVGENFLDPTGTQPAFRAELPALHRRVVANSAQRSQRSTRPYTNVIPGTRVTYSMVPIAAGNFMMGSPDSEPGRQRDEGPLHRVSLDAFWMRTCEVTWDEYLEFLEAEWEYAARAGSTNAYFFGDNPAVLRDYAWTADNSDFKYQPVGTKKPNPWGLYDIYGNVFEWCLDQYREDWYSECLRKGLETNVWRRAEEALPVVVRGGCWDDEDVTDFRSARRRASSPAWQLTDPRVPKSVWWLSDARGVGFRIVRPVKTPSPEEMLRSWIIGLKSEPPETGSAK
jgi:formylglycine-generating enzyme required for sulfatase activity